MKLGELKKSLSRPLIITLLVVSAVVLCTSGVLALFTNGGFEDGDLTGWTKGMYLNPGLTLPQPFIGASIVRNPGPIIYGINTYMPRDLTAVVGNPSATPLSLTDTNTTGGSAPPLRYPYAGHYSARINSDAGNHFNANSLVQSCVTTLADVQWDGKIHVQFAWAAVVQNPVQEYHPPEDMPYTYVVMTNVTKNTTLYEKFIFANDTSAPWLNAPGIIQYTYWQVIDRGFDPGVVDVGDNIQIECIAAGCGQSGHWGYLYVDGFGSTPPIPPDPTLTVTTGDPSGVSCTSATLNGTLAATGNLQCNCFDVYFEYGNTPGNLDQETSHQTICRGDSLTFTTPLSLMPCMTYYARAVAVCSQTANFANNNEVGNPLPGTTPVYGKEVAFNTMFCCTSKTSSGGGSGGWELTSTRPYLPPMFDIPRATVSATRTSPGEQVEVNATVTNKGGSNGTTRIILYVNGQEADSKGIALASGQSTPVSFKVSRNDPGTYQVHVNSVPAGSFTVDLFNSNDILIYASVALFSIGLIGLLYYLNKRRTAA